jgi:hypothetical protein
MQIIRNAGVTINSGGYNQLQVQRAAVTSRAPVRYSGGALYGLGALSAETLAQAKVELRAMSNADLDAALSRANAGTDWVDANGAVRFTVAELVELKPLIIAEQDRRQWMKVGLLVVVGGAALWYASKKGWF